MSGILNRLDYYWFEIVGSERGKLIIIGVVLMGGILFKVLNKVLLINPGKLWRKYYDIWKAIDFDFIYHCPKCGYEYGINFDDPKSLDPKCPYCKGGNDGRRNKARESVNRSKLVTPKV